MKSDLRLDDVSLHGWKKVKYFFLFFIFIIPALFRREVDIKITGQDNDKQFNK